MTPEFGILILGLFLGGVLGFGLVKARGGLKAGLIVIGAALGGGPMLFLQGAGAAKWQYPLGLIAGVLVPRFLKARAELVDDESHRAKRIVAWMDILFIGGITLAAAVWSAL